MLTKIETRLQVLFFPYTYLINDQIKEMDVHTYSVLFKIFSFTLNLYPIDIHTHNSLAQTKVCQAK